MYWRVIGYPTRFSSALPRKFRDSTSIRPRQLPAISFDNTPFMKRPIIRRYDVLVTGTFVSNPQKRLTDTWPVVTCTQIGDGTQQNNAGIRKCLYASLFCDYGFSVHYTQQKLCGDWTKAKCTPHFFICFI